MNFLLTLLLVTLFSGPVTSWATTYWVSTAGTGGCTDIDGVADPGTYATPALLSSNNCTVAGDTIIFKNGTYTTAITSAQWTNILKAGSVGALTTVRCESHQGCTIAPSASIGFTGIITIATRSYVQVGSRTGGFIVDGVNAGTQSHGIRFTMSGSTDQVGVAVIGNSILRHRTNGISWQNNGTTKYSGMLVEYNTIGASGTPYTDAGAPHPIYIIGHNATVRFNDITTPANAVVSNSFGVHCYSAIVACTNNVITNNIVRIGGLNDRGLLVNGPGNTIANNIVKGTTNLCIDLFGSGADNNAIYHNVCDGSSTWIRVSTGATGNVATNNLCVTGATCTTSGTFTSTDNLTGVATANFVDRTNLNYSLVSTASTLINEGTAIAGRSFNGAAPEIGAHEVPAFASCTVEDGDATHIRVTFTNNVHPPLQVTDTTGLTSRADTVNNPVTAVEVVGDNEVYLTVTAITSGQVVDISYAQTGDLRDSANIGGSQTQEVFAFTNTACTNNVGAAAGHTFTQAAFEFHGLRGTEAAPVGTPYATAPENTNIQVMVGGSVRLRLALVCDDGTTEDCPATGFYPFYACAACTTAGTYTQIPDSFAADEDIGFCGTSPDPDIPTNGTATTNQLSTAGDFVPGAFVRTSNAIPTVTIPEGDKTELEYCFSFSTSATAARTYDIRLYRQDGTALDAYTVTPRMTIAPVSSGMGF